MSEPILTLRQVSHQFRGSSGTTQALDAVDLEVRPGEIVCLLGPSGCGKSTILNLAAGLLMPSAGEVLFEGSPVTGPDPARGVIFQQYVLFAWMSVRKNVEYGLKLKKVPKIERAEIAQRYLALVGLEQFAEALPRELSGGMKQRVAIARAYAVEPHLLLMDEPFGALDALTRWELIEDVITTWERKRTTICFVTHDIDEALVLGHRIVVMTSGPGRIASIVDVDAPQPRGREFMRSDRFAELRDLLWAMVHEKRRPSQPAGTSAT